MIISVFLDAGAGQSWRYKEPETGTEYSRSEGLLWPVYFSIKVDRFSARCCRSIKSRCPTLIEFSEARSTQGFQVRANNPLEGVAGRVALLNRLGAAIEENKHTLALKDV